MFFHKHMAKPLVLGCFVLLSCQEPTVQPNNSPKSCSSDQNCPAGYNCLNNYCQIPVICGDGIITKGQEECDDGNTDSFDGCSSTCQVESVARISLMNWNILVSTNRYSALTLIDGTTFSYTANYADWSGAKPLPPRAQAMAEGLAMMDEKPAFISVVEIDPFWKLDENFQQIRDIGYEMIYPNTPTMLTQLLYRPDQLTLLEKGYINLSYHQGGVGASMKTALTYGVFQEKSNNELFIGLSTHWEPNSAAEGKGLSKALEAIYYAEQVRVKQAQESIDLIKQLKEKYPTAHVFYGGDLNTVDFDIIYKAIAEFLPDIDTTGITINSLFTILGSKEHPSDDFTGAVQYFGDNSGLFGSRRYAIDNNLAIKDRSTTSDAEAVADVIGMTLETPIVIDYNFFSPEMTLIDYQVFEEDPFGLVSDHRPVNIVLEYYPRNLEILTPKQYPDDGNTDFYLPPALKEGTHYCFPDETSNCTEYI